MASHCLLGKASQNSSAYHSTELKICLQPSFPDSLLIYVSSSSTNIYQMPSIMGGDKDQCKIPDLRWGRETWKEHFNMKICDKCCSGGPDMLQWKSIKGPGGKDPLNSSNIILLSFLRMPWIPTFDSLRHFSARNSMTSLVDLSSFLYSLSHYPP